MCKKMQKHNKIVQNAQKIACRPEKLAQLEKICTDGVTRVTLFLHLCMTVTMKVTNKITSNHDCIFYLDLEREPDWSMITKIKEKL